MPKENPPINWKKIAESAWGVTQNTTEEKLAMLFMQSIAKVKSTEELIILLNIFFDPRCNLNNELINNFLYNIQAYFSFKIHNHPNATQPTTRLENIISNMGKDPTTSKGGIHRDIIVGKDSYSDWNGLLQPGLPDQHNSSFTPETHAHPDLQKPNKKIAETIKDVENGVPVKNSPFFP